MTVASTPTTDRRAPAPQALVRSDVSDAKTRRELHARGLGTVWVATAALSWATIGIATSFLPEGTNPLSIAAARMAVGGAVLLAIAARPATVRPLCVRRGLAWVILAAVSVAVYQVAYFTAIADAGMAIASVVTMGTIPLASGVLSRLAGVRPSRRWLTSTAGAVGGCVLLTRHGAQRDHHLAMGVGCAVVAGILYALFTTIAARLIHTGASPRTTMALAFGGAALLMSPILASRSSGWLLTPSGAGVAIYLGLVATAGAYLLYGHALRTVPVPVVATLLLAEPACATILAITLLHQRFDRLASTGLGLVCLTLLIAALPPTTTNRSQHAPRRRRPDGLPPRRRPARHVAPSGPHLTRRAPFARPAPSRTRRRTAPRQPRFRPQESALPDLAHTWSTGSPPRGSSSP